MRTYFPLRSNAKGLVAGRGIENFRDRLKIASLLSDEVVLQGGTYVLATGQTASMSLWNPRETVDSWQTAAHRSKQKAGTYPIAVESSRDNSGWRNVAEIKPDIYWLACFDPLKVELPPGCDWIEFDTVGLTSEGRGVADKMAKETIKALPPLGRGTEKQLTRDAITTHVCHDLLMANALESTVTMDRAHDAQMRRITKPQNRADLFAGGALRLALPDPRRLSWESVQEVRKHKGWREIRAVWAEIDRAAWSTTGTVADVPFAVAREYQARLHMASEDMRPNIAERVIYPHIGLTLGTLAGFAAAHFGASPPAATMIGGWTGIALDQLAERVRTAAAAPRWVTAHYDLVDITKASTRGPQTSP